MISPPPITQACSLLLLLEERYVGEQVRADAAVEAAYAFALVGLSRAVDDALIEVRMHRQTARQRCHRHVYDSWRGRIVEHWGNDGSVNGLPFFFFFCIVLIWWWPLSLSLSLLYTLTTPPTYYTMCSTLPTTHSTHCSLHSTLYMTQPVTFVVWGGGGSNLWWGCSVCWPLAPGTISLSFHTFWGPRPVSRPASTRQTHLWVFDN